MWGRVDQNGMLKIFIVIPRGKITTIPKRTNTQPKNQYKSG
jgi:hypothetical protein